MNYEEQHMQMQFVEYLLWRNILHFNHSPNEGKRDPREGNKNKRMGTSPGFPDLEIPLPCNGKHGLYIEFKTEKGSLSPQQREWLNYLNEQGYTAEVARSFDGAVDILKEYLGEKQYVSNKERQLFKHPRLDDKLP